MKNIIKKIIILLLSISLFSCEEKKAESSDLNNQIEISSKTYDGNWPFTVENGILKCIQYNIDGINPELTQGVVFESNGKTYALNGVALTYASNYGYSEIEEIWAFDEEHTKSLINMGFSEEEANSQKVRISIGKLIDEGLKLCK